MVIGAVAVNKRLFDALKRSLVSNILINIAICEVNCLTMVRHEPYRFKQNQEHQLKALAC